MKDVGHGLTTVAARNNPLLVARSGQPPDELIETEDHRRTLLIEQPSEENLLNVGLREPDGFYYLTPVVLQQPQRGLQSGLDLLQIQLTNYELLH